MLMDTQSASTRTFPLSLANEGEWVRVVTVAGGGKNMLKRLFAMGITDGSELEIIHRQTENGIVIRYGETRWAIGYGMAHKVIVVKINAPANLEETGANET